MKEKGLPLLPLITVWANEAKQLKGLAWSKGNALLNINYQMVSVSRNFTAARISWSLFRWVGLSKDVLHNVVWIKRQRALSPPARPRQSTCILEDTRSSPQQQGEPASTIQRAAVPTQSLWPKVFPQPQLQLIYWELITVRLCTNSALHVIACGAHNILAMALGLMNVPRSHILLPGSSIFNLILATILWIGTIIPNSEMWKLRPRESNSVNTTHKHYWNSNMTEKLNSWLP